MRIETKPMFRVAARLLGSGFAILSFIPAVCSGSEIFHWIDENGVLNFSDWAPEDSSVEVSKLNVGESNPRGYDPREDQSSILDQAERTNARWEELKERQQERRKERFELGQQQRAPQYVEYDYPYFDPGYFFRAVQSPGFVHPRPFTTQKRQLFALDQLGLLARPRPHSINSSAHLALISAGKNLNAPVLPPRPGQPRHLPASMEW